MNDKVNKVFEILGIKPNEPFKITNLQGEPIITPTLRLTPQLHVQYKHIKHGTWDLYTETSLRNLLISNSIRLHRVKSPIKLTEDDKAIITYAKTLGAKWIAQDRNGDVFAYTHKPDKHPRYLTGMWRFSEKHPDIENIHTYRLHKNLSFISWEDEEPYYIGDEENE